jgi:hypothetical protein
MNRAARRAGAARARHDRVAAFRDRAAGGSFETSLCAVGAHRPQDGGAIMNWLIAEPTARPTCFCCRGTFSATRRPGGFLCATATRAGPKAGTAVAGICVECWTGRSAAQIEEAALSCLHRNLNTRGGFAED